MVAFFMKWLKRSVRRVAGDNQPSHAEANEVSTPDMKVIAAYRNKTTKMRKFCVSAPFEEPHNALLLREVLIIIL